MCNTVVTKVSHRNREEENSRVLPRETLTSLSSSSRHLSILSDNGRHHGSGHVALSSVKARLE